MMFRNRVRITLILCTLAMAMSGCAQRADASVTLLLEEPYGKLGFFTATGHAAVYLSGVCAESPTVLRPCKGGEDGIVLSRYDGVGKYDWVAIPLIPYLYAVEDSDAIPLFADVKMVAVLRDRYRRTRLEQIAPDAKGGEAPGGNWYELVGSSYDRTIYGFELETTTQQDEAFIQKYNALQNRSHFRTVSSNCADFAKNVVNFYYPKAVHRSLVADVGITTPKQLAKMMVKFSAHHPELQFSRLVIPQVPGSMARSSAVHGVVESFFKSKKYIVPSAVVSPIFAGCVAAVYVGTGTGRFDPARDARIFNAAHERETPLGPEDRRAYQRELANFMAQDATEASGKNVAKSWERLQSQAFTEFDDLGRPVLMLRVGEQRVSVGASESNVLSTGAPRKFVRELLEARLQAELQRGRSPKVSELDVARDWMLLQQTINHDGSQLSAQMTQRSFEVMPAGATRFHGNRL